MIHSVSAYSDVGRSTESVADIRQSEAPWIFCVLRRAMFINSLLNVFTMGESNDLSSVPRQDPWLLENPPKIRPLGPAKKLVLFALLSAVRNV